MQAAGPALYYGYFVIWVKLVITRTSSTESRHILVLFNNCAAY